MQTSWLTSTIAFELQNEAYEDDHLMRRLSAVKENKLTKSKQSAKPLLAYMMTINSSWQNSQPNLCITLSKKHTNSLGGIQDERT